MVQFNYSFWLPISVLRYLFSITVRPGMCPPDTVICAKPRRNECQSDINCPSPKKCCYNSCAYHCVNPV
uniref:WAP domain-containing protein n=1 Tax=Anolis carolinensis TaxID=28377 RepID=A0A803T3W0_ANOCA